MAYTVSNNTPSSGYIQWSGLHMQYNGTSYTISDGYTNAVYVYWTTQSPNNLVVTNSYPTLSANDCLVFLNKSGTALTVPGATAIDGSLIVPETVLANALAANSVTADKIKAGAVTASAIAADAVGASAIAAGAVTAEQLAADSVTAAAVAADAIGAEAIAAGAVLADAIAAGAVTAEKIKAYSVTADRLAIGTGGNLYCTGYDTFEQITDDTIYYYKSGNISSCTISTDCAYYGTKCLKIETSDSISSGSVYLGQAAKGYGCIPVQTGKIYRVSYWAKSTSSMSLSTYLALHASNTASQNGHANISSNVTIGTSWTRVSGVYTVTSSPYISINIDTKTQSAVVYIDAIQIELVSSTTQAASDFQPAGTTYIDGGNIYSNSITANQIKTGTITATQIAANTITAAKIASGTITATQIATSAITTDKIAAQAITAAKIATGTITATQIAANTITAAKIATGTITATQIAANTITAAKIATGTITATQIAANTITAAKIAANAITADKIATDAIKSRNYVSGSAGSYLNLSTGAFDSPNLKWTSSGIVTMTGATIKSSSGSSSIELSGANLSTSYGGNNLARIGVSSSGGKYYTVFSSDYTSGGMMFGSVKNNTLTTALTIGWDTSSSKVYSNFNSNCNFFGDATFGNGIKVDEIYSTANKIRLFAKIGYPAIELIQEVSGSNRLLLRPCTNSYGYLGSASYRWNTGFFTNSITQSDLKTKNILGTIEKSVDFIKKLNPVLYTLKDGDSAQKRKHMGFVAQEVAQTVKDLEMGDLALYQASKINEDGTESHYEAGTPDEQLLWGLNYNEIIAPLVSTVQYLLKQVEELKKN